MVTLWQRFGNDRQILPAIADSTGRVCEAGVEEAESGVDPTEVPREELSGSAEIHLGIEQMLAYLAVAVAVAFDLVFLLPEVLIRVPRLNDEVLHLIAANQAAGALAAGHDPTDPWLATIGMGYALFRHYQHLPYVVLAVVHLVMPSAVTMADLLDWTRYLLLAAFPISVYWSMRRLRFPFLAAGFAALVSSLLATNGLYGFDFSSYVWGGFGLYTELWGMVLLPPAIAQTYVTLREGRGYVWSALLLSATLLCHLVLGYLALGSICALAIVAVTALPHGSVGQRLLIVGRRLAACLTLMALATSYFLVPFLLEHAYMNRSVWELTTKYDSFGARWVLGNFVRGDLLDYGRFPSLTILFGVGIIVAVWRWRDARYRIPLVITGLWLALYFGRPTWGHLLDLLPLSRDLQFHRLIEGVDVGAILLIGVGLAAPWQWALSRRAAPSIVIVAVATVLLLAPVYHDRVDYLTRNALWMAQTQQAVDSQQADLTALQQMLRSLPPGRVYAGLPTNWGQEFVVGSVPMYALLQSSGFDMLGYLYHALSLNSDVEVLFNDQRASDYDVFDVRYVVAPAGHPMPRFARLIGGFGQVRLYEVETSGYFELVQSTRSFSGSSSQVYPAAARWLSSSLPQSVDYPRVSVAGTSSTTSGAVALASAPAIIAAAKPAVPTSPGRIVSETVGTGTYAAQVSLDVPATLLLKVTYDPGWHASIDGVTTSTSMLMPSYIGVPVPAGDHMVRLTYDPGPLRGILAVLDLLALVGAGLAERRRDALGSVLARVYGSLHSRAGSRSINVLAQQRWSTLQRRARPLIAQLPCAAGAAAAALLAGLPLFRFAAMSGHDALEYLPRSEEFFSLLASGQWFPRWAPDLSAGHGEPFFSFNPPMIYYLTAAFHALGANFVAAEDLASFALLLTASLGMYALAASYFGRHGGLVSATAYVFAPYVLVALYVRHALADFAAFAFLPLIFLGIWRFAERDGVRWLTLATVSLAALLLSSSSVALIAVPAFSALALWQALHRRSWSVLGRGAWALMIGVGLAAFFWVPALGEKQFVQVGRLLQGSLNYHNHFVYLFQLLYSPWGYGLSVPGPTDGMSFAIGPAYLALAVVAAFFLPQIRQRSPATAAAVGFALVLSVVAALLTTFQTQWLWDRVPLLPYLQFPWRFLALVAFGTAFVAGAAVALVDRSPQLRNALTATLLGILVVGGLLIAHPQSDLRVIEQDYTPSTVASHDVAVTTAREYQPVWVSTQPAAPVTQRLTMLSGSARLLSQELAASSYRFDVEVMQAAQIRVNTYYFPGWSLWVDGAPQLLQFGGADGTMQFALSPGRHLVQLAFVDTPIRSVARSLSLVALAALLLTPLLSWALHRAPAAPRIPDTDETLPAGDDG